MLFPMISHAKPTQNEINFAVESIIDGSADFVFNDPIMSKDKQLYYYVRSENFRKFVTNKISYFMNKYDVKNLDDLQSGDILALYNMELNQIIGRLVDKCKECT